MKDEEKKEDDGCETPGEKIRSKGQGKGEGHGKGKGPIGVPKRMVETETGEED